MPFPSYTFHIIYLLIHDGISYTAWHEWILLLHILTIANTLTHTRKQTPEGLEHGTGTHLCYVCNDDDDIRLTVKNPDVIL